MKNKVLILLACCAASTLSLKILSIQDIGEDEQFNITIKDTSTFKGSKFSVCCLVKTIYRTYMLSLDIPNITGSYLNLEDFYGTGKSLILNFGNYGLHSIDLPGGQEIVPNSWTANDSVALSKLRRSF